MIEKYGVTNSSKLLLQEPMGLFDFVKLESNARALISDSGTCPEEACLFGVPSVIIRKTTERPELIQCGSSLICGTEVEDIANAVDLMTRDGNDWMVPEEYTYSNVSERVVRILMGNIC
jgi:UDP-N-acetylglucosamine 2-epimerase (non-hydrolysing)